MKKFLTTIVALLAINVAVQAKTTDYGFSVAGIEVTSANAKAITGTAIQGSVSYDYGTNTLTLTECKINCTGNVIPIYNKSCQDLKIVFSGSGQLTSETHAVRCNARTSFTSGKNCFVFITCGNKGVCLLLDEADAIIKGPGEFEFIQPDNGTGILGTNGSKEKLYLDEGAKLFINCGTLGICGMALVKLTDAEYLKIRRTNGTYPQIYNVSELTFDSRFVISEPEGAYFDADSKSIKWDGGDIKQEWEVCIIKNGVDITADNFPDDNFRKFLLEQKYGSDRFISYDERNNISTLDVAEKNINTLDGIRFFSKLVNLRCNDNNLTELNPRGNRELLLLACANNNISETAMQELVDNLPTVDTSEGYYGRLYPVGDDSSKEKNKMSNAQVQIAKSKGWRVRTYPSGKVYEGYDYTGIDEVRADAAKGSSAVYNLAGQRVGSKYKGIVIKNGIKAIVK